MSRPRMRKGRLIIGIVGVLLAFLACGFALLSPRLTTFVEGDKFRAEMEKETAKGLHFSSAHYERIKRTGTWTVKTPEFQAKEGRKALRSTEAHGIEAKFNPWGVLLRRWQLDYVHVQGGEVGIQVYEPKPEPSPAKPWYAIFLPNRVYLKRVESEPVDVTWKFREKRAGFFGTRLLITPHVRDFEYQARGGEMKMSPFPHLRLQHTHLLITKTLLTLYNLDLQSENGTPGAIHAEGKAGTRDDKSIDFKVNLDHVPINEWLPNEWDKHINGEVAGKIHWTGENLKLETSRGDAALRVENGRIDRLPTLKKLAALTGEEALEDLRLNICQMDFEWRYPDADIKNLIIEDQGKFRAQGSVTVRKRKLSGAIEFGVARRLLTGCQGPKRFSRASAMAIFGPLCICPERSMNPNKISVRVSSTLSRNRPAQHSEFCSASLVNGCKTPSTGNDWTARASRPYCAISRSAK